MATKEKAFHAAAAAARLTVTAAAAATYGEYIYVAHMTSLYLQLLSTLNNLSLAGR